MIHIEHLTKRFGERIIFEDLNLDLQLGTTYALIGNSGSGKTTLLNILAKLETFNTGKVSYNDQDLAKITDTLFFRDYLGYLFQNFGLLDNETVAENLKLGLVGKKVSPNEATNLYKEVLQKVGLSYVDLKQKIYELSGGEAQRIAIAKLILKNPPIILADEPTAALDPNTSLEVINLLLSLKRADNIIILATHNPVIWEMTDEVLKIQGR